MTAEAKPSPIKIVASINYIDCPFCSASQYGFVGDPRGHAFNCDTCNRQFQVPADAEVDLG